MGKFKAFAKHVLMVACPFYFGFGIAECVRDEPRSFTSVEYALHMLFWFILFLGVSAACVTVWNWLNRREKKI